MKRILLSILLFINSFLFAQTEDVALWTGVKVSQQIDKKAKIGLTQGLRFDNNISNTHNVYTQFKLDYDILKSLRFSMAYRWSKKQSWTKEFRYENRYQFDLRYKFKLEDLSINNRMRFQSKYVDFKTTEYGYIPRNVFRNETTVEYKVSKKINPYVGFEFFYPINVDFRTINKVRYQIGSSFEITKSLSTEVFFLLQQEINVNDHLKSYITGLNVSYKLPKIKLKKKKGKDKEGDTEESPVEEVEE